MYTDAVTQRSSLDRENHNHQAIRFVQQPIITKD
jgi:hypothetical protein